MNTEHLDWKHLNTNLMGNFGEVWGMPTSIFNYHLHIVLVKTIGIIITQVAEVLKLYYCKNNPLAEPVIAVSVFLVKQWKLNIVTFWITHEYLLFLKKLKILRVPIKTLEQCNQVRWNMQKFIYRNIFKLFYFYLI